MDKSKLLIIDISLIPDHATVQDFVAAMDLGFLLIHPRKNSVMPYVIDGSDIKQTMINVTTSEGKKIMQSVLNKIKNHENI